MGRSVCPSHSSSRADSDARRSHATALTSGDLDADANAIADPTAHPRADTDSARRAELDTFTPPSRATHSDAEPRAGARTALHPSGGDTDTSGR